MNPSIIALIMFVAASVALVTGHDAMGIAQSIIAGALIICGEMRRGRR